MTGNLYQSRIVTARRVLAWTEPAIANALAGHFYKLLPEKGVVDLPRGVRRRGIGLYVQHRWTDHEVDRLIVIYKAGATIDAMAEELKRDRSVLSRKIRDLFDDGRLERRIRS